VAEHVGIVHFAAVHAGTLISTNPNAIAGGTDLPVGNTSLFGTVTQDSSVESSVASAAVPEPKSLILLAASLVSLLLYMWRRRTQFATVKWNGTMGVSRI
jgi:hypothetical protein